MSAVKCCYDRQHSTARTLFLNMSGKANGGFQKIPVGSRGDDIWHFTAVCECWILPSTSSSFHFFVIFQHFLKKLRRETGQQVSQKGNDRPIHLTLYPGRVLLNQQPLSCQMRTGLTEVWKTILAEHREAEWGRKVFQNFSLKVLGQWYVVIALGLHSGFEMKCCSYNPTDFSPGWLVGMAYGGWITGPMACASTTGGKENNS